MKMSMSFFNLSVSVGNERIIGYITYRMIHQPSLFPVGPTSTKPKR